MERGIGINHQNRPGVPQVFGDVGKLIIKHDLGIPLCRSEQALHPLRTRISSHACHGTRCACGAV